MEVLQYVRELGCPWDETASCMHLTLCEAVWGLRYEEGALAVSTV